MSKNKYGPTRTVPLRRKREGRTNYRKRLNLLKSRKPRLVVHASTGTITVQIIEYHPDGDKVLTGASSRELLKHGWKAKCGNIPAAYLVGFLLAKKSKESRDVVLDSGLISPNSKIYAAVKGALDGGLNVPHSEGVFPKDDRLTGAHIAQYAVLLKDNPEKYQKQFSQYVKAGLKPEHLPVHFEEVKQNITRL